MSSESLHEDKADLSRETRDLHRALVSLTEELDAVDWYRQRAEGCRDDALKVLRENHVSATSTILDTDDRDAFGEALDKEWPGPVPYTLLIAPGGKVIYRKMGPIDPLEVRRAIVKQLGRTYASKKPK